MLPSLRSLRQGVYRALKVTMLLCLHCVPRRALHTSVLCCLGAQGGALTFYVASVTEEKHLRTELSSGQCMLQIEIT